MAIEVRSNNRLKNGNPRRPGSLDDHRAIELLVDAGFTPVEAIRIGALNGASGKAISDIGNVAIVFRDGIGYDPEKLLETARGRDGQY
ncbi:hypothetical protein [Phenylobacterium sp.]|uniref:hypothetical protein n=1 Tax=Phenylobacterium sp. TaxID=1871053 RepID=UPI0037C8B65E